MNKTINCGRGAHIPYEDFMHLINLTFGFETPETQFLGLLPKLYKPAYRPQDSNYVVTETADDGTVTLTAAVGAFDHTITVAGRRLPCRGIGNVAVHPDHRSKGYMKMAMEAAIEDMIKDGIVLSTLGGRRQRYQYFSYDKCGPCHTFALTADNLRHTYGTLDAPYTVHAVADTADPLIDAVKALSDASPVAPERPRDTFLDIAETWHATLYAVTSGDRFVGYAIVEPNGFVTEARVATPEDFMPLMRSIFATVGRESITVRLPAFETADLAAIAPIAEGVQTGCSMSYTVLNYTAVIDAFLALKASYATLSDGILTLLIHGRGGDERLRISIEQNHPTVTVLPPDATAPATVELSHMEALNLLFAPFSPRRNTLPAPWNSWFPLPIWMYRADEV